MNSPTVETGVTGKVREYHYRCIAPEKHEFSMLTKGDFDIDAIISCPVTTCIEIAELLGDGAAEIATNPVDLLEN